MDNKFYCGIITHIDKFRNFGFINSWEGQYYFDSKPYKDYELSGFKQFQLRKGVAGEEEAFNLSKIDDTNILFTDIHFGTYLEYFVKPKDVFEYKVGSVFEELEAFVKTIMQFDINNILLEYKIELHDKVQQRRGDRDDFVDIFYLDNLSHQYEDSDAYLYELLYFHEIILKDSVFADGPGRMRKYKEDVNNWNKLLEKSTQLSIDRKKYILKNYNRKNHIEITIASLKKRIIENLLNEHYRVLSIMFERYFKSTHLPTIPARKMLK